MTKWDEIYFRLNASDFRDRRWEGNNFGKQRVQDVVAALKWLERHDITKYNINSISTAKLGTVVVGALGGKKARVSVLTTSCHLTPRRSRKRMACLTKAWQYATLRRATSAAIEIKVKYKEEGRPAAGGSQDSGYSHDTRNVSICRVSRISSIYVAHWSTS
jgi:hypothetical protein